MLDRGQVEAREMVEFHPLRIGQYGLEVRRVIGRSRREADEVLIPPAIGNLQQAQPVARGDQSHGFGIDRNRPGREHAFGEIFFVEIDSHMTKVLRPIRARWKAPQ